MKKYRIIIVITAACLALCAAVWPQTEVVEETPTPLQESVVSDPAPTVEDIATEVETPLPTEGEKVEIPQAEPLDDIIQEPLPVPEGIPEILEAQPMPEPEPESEPASTPAPTPTPGPSQTVIGPQPGDMVYVPGFGWLECQGPGEVIHDENIYENGNKIGVMG